MIRLIVPLAALSLILAPSLRAAKEAGSRPNLVFILSDDMGWNQPGFNGDKNDPLAIRDAMLKNLDQAVGRIVAAIDMTGMLFEGNQSPRSEIVFEVTGSVRLPTIRSGDWKLMGEMLFNIAEDPYEQNDIAKRYPGIVQKLAARLATVGKQRPPLGDKPLLMDPPLPYIYGLKENGKPPAWLVKHVDRVRARQPKKWAPGETPWPQAPIGANANQQPARR